MSIMKPSAKSKKYDASVFHVGIDVAKDTLAVDAGDAYAQTIENTPEAIARMVRAIRGICPAGQPPLFCAEHTGSYGLILAGRLRTLGEQVALVAPGRVRAFARSEGIIAKTDPIDAALIRSFAEEKRPFPTPAPSPVRCRLRDLTRGRDLLVRQRTALSLESSATSDKDALAVLRKCSADLTRHIGCMEKLIDKTVESDPGTRRVAAALKTIVGVKERTAAVITALVPELGSLGRQRAAALCGCAPHPADSGTWHGKRKTGQGREGLRAALYMPSLTACIHDPVLHAFYQRLKDEKHKPGLVARVAVMRKLFVRMDAVVAMALREEPGATDEQHPAIMSLTPGAAPSPCCKRKADTGRKDVAKHTLFPIRHQAAARPIGKQRKQTKIFKNRPSPQTMQKNIQKHN